VQPDAGSIRAFGHELVGLPPELRPYADVGRSFQDARLYPGLTVEETLLVAFERKVPVRVLPALLGLPWARRAEREKRALADELVGLVGLGAYRDKLVSELSTGTRRIVDIATILAQRPRLLLLDEPTSGIAQKESEAFGPLMRRVADELECSVLIIEHDMPLITALSDRIYALEAGRVIAAGSPHEVTTDERVIASYLGTDQAAIRRSGALAP
jgi:ABC-type branched-subunit amino acid transport system ATPase component